MPCDHSARDSSGSAAPPWWNEWPTAPSQRGSSRSANTGWAVGSLSFHAIQRGASLRDGTPIALGTQTLWASAGALIARIAAARTAREADACFMNSHSPGRSIVRLRRLLLMVGGDPHIDQTILRA